ncbi:MAG: tRNA 2-selenouridine(34) synthase MnmH [Candidatus Delongbacteria bacterium]|nr:tRNA 2-selenouridine(34) synthase MnmH [Candidatus Delongbacteria bacterium]MCG2761404.1 tRNA 2-selenouridine(34) synthase MnmH [Candidatus Delongbacteria bacterium]
MQENKKDRSRLIQFVKENEYEISQLPDSYRDYFTDKLDLISIDEWIEQYRNNKNTITVDVRSEAEFSEDHLPGAINFPILNNSERDEVGFLYKQVSPKAALLRALKAADNKTENIRSFCEGLKDKEVLIYCWRGGGRSSAACHYFTQYGLKHRKIADGYKSYRSKIYYLFYEDPSSLKFIVLAGLTGCGKTEIIENLTGKIPVFDIEKAAGHASSLFGHIRFEVKTDDIPASQIQFENKLFEQIISNSKAGLPFLTESESKRISNFNIPDALYKNLLSSPVIQVKSCMKKRVERIKSEYFSDGVERAYKTVENSDFLMRLLGHDKINSLLALLTEGKIDEFCEWFLKEYYDIRYATKFNKIITQVVHNDLLKASDEVSKIIETKH